MGELTSQRLVTTMGTLGLAAAMGSCVLWIVFLLANPYEHNLRMGESVPVADTRQAIVVLFMVALWIGGGWSAFRRRSGWMLGIGLVAFFPVGLYVLLVPGVFSSLGMVNLLFIVLSIGLLTMQRRRSSAQ